MDRSIPPSLAPVIAHLELEQARTVTVQEIARIAAEHGIGTPGKLVAHRLAQRGWLLPTAVRGTWEFAPAERAGPFSDSDPFRPLRATLESKDDLGAALALGSALWLRNFAERAPDQHEVAVPPGTDVPAALRRSYRIVRHEPRLPPGKIDGVPVHRPATILVHLANRPADVRSWVSVLGLLKDLIEACPYEELARELEDRPHTTMVRFAYLTSGLRPELARRLKIERAGTAWFGPRGKLRRHDARWNVADTVLPFHPTKLGDPG